jgi:hypothetical protein
MLGAFLIVILISRSEHRRSSPLDHEQGFCLCFWTMQSFLKTFLAEERNKYECSVCIVSFKGHRMANLLI